MDSVTLEETRFHESISHNDGGSIFLGYLYGVLTVAGVLPGGEDLKLGLPDLGVRITQSGRPAIGFPPKRDAEGKFVMTQRDQMVKCYFAASKETREALTALVFATPAVQRAVVRAEAQRAAA